MSQIEKNAKELKLVFVRENYKQEISRAQIQDKDHETFLDELLAKEVDARKERAVQTRIRNAKFPKLMSLEEFKLDYYSQEIQEHIKKLTSLEFIENKENIILIGNPGVGKTALALTLGLKACLELKNVLFINVSELIIQFREAMSQNQITRYRRKFEKYDLVILDELGFVSFNKESGELLFHLLSSRNEKGSMIITSNLTVNKWNEIFGDTVLTTAIVDRLAYKSHLIDMSGESLRIRTTKEWQKNNS